MLSNEEVVRRIRDRGANRAFVRFSGGCDDGGPDEIVLLDGDAPVATMDRTYGGLAPKSFVDHALEDALASPIYDRWYGFAGDFSVSGTVVWDLEENLCTLEDSHNDPQMWDILDHPVEDRDP